MPNDLMNLPPEVIDYVGSIFAGCNDRVSEKISRMPTTHETSLDLSLIEAISQFAAPQRIEPNWVVRLDTHYLGGGRHFGEWEIADIGFIIVLRTKGVVRLRKIALLQSKRLYPDEQSSEEDTPLDYMIGFGRLLQGDDQDLAAVEERTFHFADSSVYRQLKIEDRQYRAIGEYEMEYSIPVHYLLYHPLVIPWAQTIPVATALQLPPHCEVGGQVIRARDLRGMLTGRAAGSSPSYLDVLRVRSWPVQEFVADELLRCREGYNEQAQLPLRLRSRSTKSDVTVKSRLETGFPVGGTAQHTDPAQVAQAYKRAFPPVSQRAHASAPRP